MPLQGDLTRSAWRIAVAIITLANLVVSPTQFWATIARSPPPQSRSPALTHS